MKLTRREAMATMAASTVVAGIGVQSAVPNTDPPVLWYREPATVWTEALPIGNGVLGAMVFGGIANDRLQLNEGTLWAGGPYDPVNPEANTALPEVRTLVFEGRIKEAEELKRKERNDGRKK